MLRRTLALGAASFSLLIACSRGGAPLSVKITFATLSVLHGVVKHAIFAGVYR